MEKVLYLPKKVNLKWLECKFPIEFTSIDSMLFCKKNNNEYLYNRQNPIIESELKSLLGDLYCCIDNVNYLHFYIDLDTFSIFNWPKGLISNMLIYTDNPNSKFSLKDVDFHTIKECYGQAVGSPSINYTNMAFDVDILSNGKIRGVTPTYELYYLLDSFKIAFKLEN